MYIHPRATKKAILEKLFFELMEVELVNQITKEADLVIDEMVNRHNEGLENK